MSKDNTGVGNSGHRNSGNFNSGNYNSGDFNSGDYNSGDYNSGDYNSGNFNSGHRNSGDYQVGVFNTIEPDKIMVFDKWLDMKPSEFYDKYNTYMGIPLNRWIYEEDMTKREKKEVDGWKEMGGYLKTLPYKEACQIWWKENPDEHQRFLGLPHFDPEIFEEITGIDVNKPEEEIEIDGKKFSKQTIKNALKEYVE